MKFVPIPKFPCRDAAAFEEFRQIFQIPGNIVAFPKQVVLAGAIPAEGDGIKPWRDNAPRWFRQIQTCEYFVIRGSVTLKLRTAPGDAGAPIVDAENLMQLEGFYSREAIAFYNRRFLRSNGTEFARIPRIVRVTVDAAEATRLNINAPDSMPPVAVEWPIGIPLADGHVFTTLPSKVALRLNGDTVEAFNIDDYDREIPIPGSDDEALFDELTAILAMPGRTKAERVAAVRQAVAR